MKKRVEADLISIAHRILKLKNKSEVAVLQVEIKKLYDAITILKFYNDNFEQVKASVSEADLNDKLNNFLDVSDTELHQAVEINTVFIEELPEVVMEHTEPADDSGTDEATLSEEETTSNFDALFEIETTPLFEPVKSSPKEISFEELIGKNYDGADFVKPSQLEEEKKQFLFEKAAHGLSISLNDRIGFEQQLFDGSSEDFNRVLSQLNTFDTFLEAKNFIDEIVKPDYDNWVNKDDFANRFIELVENKFK